MHRWILILALVLMGSDCEDERLTKLNKGLLTMEDGTPLCREDLPYQVVSETLEHPDALQIATDNVNSFFTTNVLVSEMDSDLFAVYDVGPSAARYGVILVSEGYPGTPTDFSDLGFFSDVGGTCEIAFDARGNILWADIVVNVDYAYHEDTVVAILLHEFGHAMGLAHDGQSIDLNSCMMPNNVPSSCEFTVFDVGLIEDCHSTN